MLEESGTVVDTDGKWVWVETVPRSACTHCGTASCSTSVVAKLFASRRNRFRLRNSLSASAGERVVIGIPDRILVAVSLRAYLWPLLIMVASVALAEQLGAGEVSQVCVGLLGLFGGLRFIGWMSRPERNGERLAPRLLRRSSNPAPHIELDELTRSKT